MNITECFDKLHKFVMLTADFMFANGNMFMITSARKLKLATIEHIPSQTAEHISKSLNRMIKLYRRGGFIIRVILMGIEFERVDKLMGNVKVNIAAAREHVGEVDRTIRTVNEYGIGIVNKLPYYL